MGSRLLQLSQNNVLQASLVAALQNSVETQPGQSASDDTVASSMAGKVDPRLEMIFERIEMIKLPEGWSLNPRDVGHFRNPEPTWEYIGWAFYKVFGLFMSVLTIWVIASSWLDIKKSFARYRTSTPSGENQKNAL